jgi:hypothetical protein
MRTKLMIVVIISLSILPASALPASLPYTPHVQVTVYADTLASKIRSCLTQELHQLPGVTIVESEPEWIIDVIGFRSINRAGRVIGYALSVVILEAIDVEPLDADSFDLAPFSPEDPHPLRTRIAAHQLSPEMETLPATLQGLKDHRLAVGSLKDLKKLCKEVVTDFDTRHLEPMRKLFEVPADE